jgi:hypothetical protein
MPLGQSNGDSTITPDKIDTWQDYFLKAKERLVKQCKLFIYTWVMKCWKLLSLFKMLCYCCGEAEQENYQP